MTGLLSNSICLQNAIFGEACFGMEDDARAIITFITLIDLLIVLMKNTKVLFDNVRFCRYHLSCLPIDPIVAASIFGN